MNVQSSASLKRLNHLQCEMSVVYHEMSQHNANFIHDL